MDSFDDFEFKPLTEGLGFHKKNPQDAQSMNDKDLPPLEPRPKIAALENLKLNPNALNFDLPKFELPPVAPEIDLFSKPLPRTEEDVPKKQQSIAQTTSIPKFNPRFTKPLANPLVHQEVQTHAADLLSILGEPSEYRKEIAREKLTANKVDTTVEASLVEVAPAPLSLFLDLTVISGLAILFVLGLVVATSLDIVPILNSAAQDLGTQLGLGLLLYSVSQLYLILSRSFFGQTLGEWSMDTQLGKNEEQDSLSYIFKLIARTAILALTGFFVLPVISVITKKDITGRLTGLKLYRK